MGAFLGAFWKEPIQIAFKIIILNGEFEFSPGTISLFVSRRPGLC